MDELRWGILATGTIANKFAATICEMKKEGHSLVAVASRTLASATSFAEVYGVPHAYGSYEQMLTDPQVDIVYVSTPNHVHYEHTRMCLEMGKHVLCEKPFTINEKQARALYQLADEKGLFLMEAFWISTLPGTQKLLELLNQGVIGQIRHIRCDFGFLSKGARRERKLKGELAGGALLDVGIYNLGFLYMVMGGRPLSFHSTYHLNEFGTDDSSSILLEYPDNRTACVTQAIGLNLGRGAVIYGTEGEINIPDYQMLEVMYLKTHEGEQETYRFPFEINGFEYQIRHVQHCLRHRQQFCSLWSWEMSIELVSLLEQIRSSWGIKFPCE